MSQATAAIAGTMGAAAWGGGDFAGGLAMRSASAFSVLFASQFAGFLVLGTAAWVMNEPFLDGTGLLIAAVAGLLGAVGILLLYRGLARGPMTLISPLSAVLAATVPLPFSWMSEGAPQPLQLAGIVIGVAAIWLAAGGRMQGDVSRTALLLGIGAGVAFGLFFVILERATQSGTLVPLAVAKATGSVVVFPILLFRRQALLPAGTALLLAAAAGTLDSVGNIWFAVAARIGRLDVSALLVSLYPVTTILLAYLILNERLSKRQTGGVVLALACVLLIALV